MKPPKYTEEDIIAAGKSLQARSKDVSPNAIKLQLGGGNPARIKKVWDEHAGDPESSEPGQSSYIARLTLTTILLLKSICLCGMLRTK